MSVTLGDDLARKGKASHRTWERYIAGCRCVDCITAAAEAEHVMALARGSA